MTSVNRVQHATSITSSIFNVWDSSTQSIFYWLAKNGRITEMAEAAVLKTLESISEGQLTISTSTATHHFPIDRSVSSKSASSVIEHDSTKCPTIVVKNESFFLRLLASHDIGFAEAYMYGDIDMNSDELVDIFRVFSLNERHGAFSSLIDSPLSRLFAIPARMAAGRFVASLKNSQPNISAHYDLGNDIFKNFLSSDMTYSCAIFPSLDADLKLGKSGGVSIIDDTGDGIEANQDPLYHAQMRKLKHIIERADIRPGHRVLEIGSGWGSLAFLITNTVQNTTVDTITLSLQQAEYVQEKIDEMNGHKKDGGEARVRVHVMDYRLMPPEWEGAFDRVVSVEMLEAVGKEYYETYFATIDWALKKDTGVACVQSITIPEGRYDQYVKTEDFIRKWVLFPGGILPTVTGLTAAVTSGSSGRLLIESISNIGPHYARTLREWRQRFEAGFHKNGNGPIQRALREEHPDTMGGPRGDDEAEVFRRKWIYYFCYCEAGFAMRLLGDHIITLTREGNVEYGCQIFS